MRHWGKILIRLAITAAALAWALSDVQLSEVWVSIGQGDLRLLGAAVFVTTSGFLIRAMRWDVLLQPVKPDTTLHSRWVAVAVHFMANNVIPLRVGEFARAWVFSRVEPVKASAAFGTIVIERLMDATVLLIFLVLPVFSSGFPDAETLASERGSELLRYGTLAVLGILGGLLALVLFPKLFVRVAHRIAPILPAPLRDPLLHALDAFLGSLGAMRDPKLLVLGFAWTFFFWLWQAAAFWLAMLAYGIETGFVSAVFTSSVVAFAVALPSAPGFVGVFHGAVLFAVGTVYGVPDAQALGYAFGYHFAAWVPITAIGLWYVWRMGLTLGDVGASEDAVEGAVESAESPEPDGAAHAIDTAEST